jgi:hypothetical protein
MRSDSEMMRGFIDAVQSGRVSLLEAKSAEIERLSFLLLEGRVDFLRGQYVPRIEKLLLDFQIPEDIEHAIDAEEGAMFAEKLFNHVVAADPDRAKKNSQWLLNLLVSKRLPLEDLEKVPDYLTKFAEMKQRRLLPADATDINRYASLGDVYARIKGEQQQIVSASDAEEREMLSQSTVHYDGGDYLILSPKTEKAAQFFGRQTEWCTAWGDPEGRHPTRSCRFDGYNRDGPLYIVIEKSSGNRWQFHRPSRQYMDVNDNPINLDQWLQSHPVPAGVFTKLEGKPVAKLGSLFAYDTPHGVVLKEKGGIISPPIIEFVGADRTITRVRYAMWHGGRQFPFDVAMREYGLDEGAIIALLNKLAYRWNALINELFEQDIFWNKRWGSLRDVGDPVMSFDDGHRWLVVRSPEGNGDACFSLVDQSKTEALYAEVFQGEFSVPGKKLDRLVVPDDYIVPLMLREDAIKGWSSDSLLKISDFSTEAATKLVSAKPSLGDIETAVRIHGPTEEIRERITKYLSEWNVDSEGWVKLDGKWFLIAETFKDGEDLMRSKGEGSAEWFADLVTGGVHIDHHGYEPYYDAKELLRTLKPENLKALGNWLAESYPAEIDDEFDGEFDPTSVNDIARLQEQVEDDGLRDAFEGAARTGSESGAESEAHDIFKRELATNRLVFFETAGGSDTETSTWQKEFKWDTKAAILIPLDDVLQVIEDDAAYDVNYSGWLDVLGEKIKPEEPYGGFTDHDDDAAAERFAESVAELIGN